MIPSFPSQPVIHTQWQLVATRPGVGVQVAQSHSGAAKCLWLSPYLPPLQSFYGNLSLAWLPQEQEDWLNLAGSQGRFEGLAKNTQRESVLNLMCFNSHSEIKFIPKVGRRLEEGHLEGTNVILFKKYFLLKFYIF